jgi:KaiC/GvpD/RAD55 family RecA-like ATPase
LLGPAFYFSTDSESQRLIENAYQFGYIPENQKNEIAELSDKEKTLKRVSVWGREKIKKWDTLDQMLESAFETFSRLVLELPDLPKSESAITRMLQKKLVWPIFTNGIQAARPKILVVDNLNIVPQDKQTQFFEQFFRLSPAARLVVFILDSAPEGERHHPWEYVCDNVIQLDSVSLEDYFIRRIEVVKTRYQDHVLGKHQLKIYQRPDSTIEANKMRRAHPYRPVGGIFIYPSLHYHLSRYKRVAPIPLTYADTLPESLSKLLEKGFPEGRCTAFIGDRGNHKSHLGYLHLLHRILDEDEAGLIISLRDDEDMTRTTLTSILGNQAFDKSPFSKRQQQEINRCASLEEREFKQGGMLNPLLDDWEKQNKIEVLYYHPGYITPEEFFHRMLISVHRLKKSKKKLTVLFNSLDQLSARFPLCAKQEIFVPSIIEALCGDGVTSIFIAVQEPGQPDEQYGLLPMADLVLSFRRGTLSGDDYQRCLRRATNAKGTLKAKGHLPTTTIKDRNEVIVEVQRFAGGQRAGSRGILELVKNSSESLFQKLGLQFARLIDEHVTYLKDTL